jgi:hypothetical protein
MYNRADLIWSIGNVNDGESRMSWDINLLCDTLNPYQSPGPETGKISEETFLFVQAKHWSFRWGEKTDLSSVRQHSSIIDTRWLSVEKWRSLFKFMRKRSGWLIHGYFGDRSEGPRAWVSLFYETGPFLKRHYKQGTRVSQEKWRNKIINSNKQDQPLEIGPADNDCQSIESIRW